MGWNSSSVENIDFSQDLNNKISGLHMCFRQVRRIKCLMCNCDKWQIRWCSRVCLIPLRIREEKAQPGLFQGKELQNKEKTHGWSKTVGEQKAHRTGKRKDEEIPSRRAGRMKLQVWTAGTGCYRIGDACFDYND